VVNYKYYPAVPYTMRFFLSLYIIVSARTAAFSLHQPKSSRSNDLVRYVSTASFTSSELDHLLEEGNMDGVISFLQQAEPKSIPAPMAAKLLTTLAALDEAVLEDTIDGDTNTNRMVAPLQEERLLECYQQLRQKVELPFSSKRDGLFGSVDMNDLTLPYREGCSIEQLQTLTDRPLSAFRPNPSTSQFIYVGAVVACGLELVLARLAGINYQPLFLATFAAAFADQVLGGGASEKVLWTLFPQLPDRVLKHEAGHLLVAHLLGCPVQSVALGSWDALTKEQSGNGSGLMGAGTSFFDPQLNAASRKGRVTRSVIDRFSIIVMAGIAAEALCFGEAEGGSDDENALAVFLTQTVQSNVNIPEQARWAATNALLLLRDNQAAYDRLVRVLQNNGSCDIGRIMLALEGCNV